MAFATPTRQDRSILEERLDYFGGGYVEPRQLRLVNEATPICALALGPSKRVRSRYSGLFRIACVDKSDNLVRSFISDLPL